MEEVKALDAEVLAVSADSVEDNRKLAESAHLAFSLLDDSEGKAMDAFGLRHSGASIDGGDIARPAVFIIDRDGRIAWRELTDNWRVRVRPETVIEQLKRLP